MYERMKEKISNKNKVTFASSCYRQSQQTAVVTGTSFITCSCSGGAPASQGEERERGGVQQLRQRGHARGEDPGGGAGGGAQDGDLHRDQPRRAVQLGE